MLPTSSLSTNNTTEVFLTLSVSNKANREVYAQILSSCPYPATMLLSNPKSLAFPAGTISISADMKSSSSKSYFSFNNFNIFALTASFSSPSKGMLPTKIFKSSPAITSAAFFCCCSAAKCINKSETITTGSVSSSPTTTSIFVPSFLTTTPCKAKGIVTH